MNMNYFNKQKGFSLIELVMVIALLGIVGTAATSLYVAGLRVSIKAQDITDALWQGRLAIERMAPEISATRSTQDIAASTSSQFTFTDMNGNSIDYRLVGSSLMRNSQILADGVNSLVFSYTDKDGNATATTADIRYVGISINVTQNNTDYTLTTSANMRELFA